MNSQLTHRNSLVSRSGLLVICGILLATVESVYAQRNDTNVARAAAADRLLTQLKGERPGCVAGVFRAGQVVYSGAFGMANVELSVPLTTESVMALDSMSKQFTGMSIILLALQGKLSLDDDVREFIPELPDYGAVIRISNLLHHTSGLKDVSELMVFAGYRPPFDIQTREWALDLIRRQNGLNFSPGSEYLYSDTNYFLLALVVERVSGKPLAAFAHDEIFVPLGMNHTEVRQDSSQILAGRATQYNKNYDPSPSDGLFHNADSHVEVLGADGVFSTISDLAKWDGNFYQPVVGGPKAIERMLETTKLIDGTSNDYASGLTVGTFHGARKVEHSGGGAGSDSEMLRLPEQQLTIAVLCNTRDEDPKDKALTAVQLTRKMLDIYFEGPTSDSAGSQGRPSPTKPSDTLPAAEPAQLQRFAGLFWNGRFDRLYRFTVKDAQITLTSLPDGRSTNLDVIAAQQLGVGPLTFTFNPASTEVSAAQLGAPVRKLFRVEEAVINAPASTDCAGEFYSKEVDAVWRFTASSDGHLILKVKNFKDEPLQPAFRDAFFSDRGLIHFTRDDNGSVNDFEVGNARAWNIKFRRISLSAQGR